MGSQQRPMMPAHIFKAAITGNEDVLVQHLKLHDQRQEVSVTIDASDSESQKIEPEEQTVQFELISATHFGDTLLHLLVTKRHKRHNELSVKVFTKKMSLLKAHNKRLETPLHCAAKVGNEEVIHDLILLDPSVVRDALGETNENGDTALHVAAYHNHTGVVTELMKLDPKVAYKENKQGSSPLYIATAKRYNCLVKTMLEVDATLACVQFSDGMFPVHVAARMDNTDLVEHFMEKYPDSAALLDPCGRNFCHTAAEEAQKEVFCIGKNFCDRTRIEKGVAIRETIRRNVVPQIREMIKSMISEADYEGNTPLHIAAMKGDRKVMRAIWERLDDAQSPVQNQEGKTAFDLAVIQLRNKGAGSKIKEYLQNRSGDFTKKWFDEIMKPTYGNVMERTQIIGLGSVLITTVAFAAAFTIPGSYRPDGTPVLGGRYMFNVFILANTLAFIQAFGSVFVLLMNALGTDANDDVLILATMSFCSAAICTTVAFGVGSYVILAPVSMPIAVLVLVAALLVASPAKYLIIPIAKRLWTWVSTRDTCSSHVGRSVLMYVAPFLLVFCFAFL